MKSEEVTGIILAGGKSSRMGYDKGLAIVDGKKMVESVHDALKKVVNKVIIISNTDVYDFLNLPVFKDEYADKGPVGGIYTGLLHSSTDKNLIVACDMPFVTESLMKKVLASSNAFQVVVPSLKDKVEPLCGFYKKEITASLKEMIEEGILPVHKVIRSFNYKILPIDESMARAFTNVNSPSDIV